MKRHDTNQRQDKQREYTNTPTKQETNKTSKQFKQTSQNNFAYMFQVVHHVFWRFHTEKRTSEENQDGHRQVYHDITRATNHPVPDPEGGKNKTNKLKTAPLLIGTLGIYVVNEFTEQKQKHTVINQMPQTLDLHLLLLQISQSHKHTKTKAHRHMHIHTTCTFTCNNLATGIWKYGRVVLGCFILRNYHDPHPFYTFIFGF